MKRAEQGELRAEYRREDLGKGVRGKYLQAYRMRSKGEAMSGFDRTRVNHEKSKNCRYLKQLSRQQKDGVDTSCIKKAIAGSLDRIKRGIKSFVIYGEPQSGKTEMMIALTAKLLDEGHKVIVVLLNDNVELLKQNLRRFRESRLDPCPKSFDEVINPTVALGNNEWVIFCKKNSKNLVALIEKLRSVKARIVLDDEADYASPNSKVNRKDVSKINALIGQLLGKEGLYIGVTATPARLDVNNTFDNANDEWVHFPPHADYTGQDVFFPLDLTGPLRYRLNPLPDSGDEPQYLRQALFNFLATVAYLNTNSPNGNQQENNYCMLIHTSGKKEDHDEDYKIVTKVIEALKDASHKYHDLYLEKVWQTAKRQAGEDAAYKVVQYVVDTIARSVVKVLNSSTEFKSVDNDSATNPKAPFTIAIGGNIVSRGVTFRNLLSMFFTRDVKHKIQQDTYIQRARMFGARNEYVENFELSIPETLFLNWHRCFVFHKLALESIKSGKIVPVWLEDSKVSAVSSSSIDKTTVRVDSGEMSFSMFDYSRTELESLVESAYNRQRGNLEVLKELQTKRGKESLPDYLLNYIQSTALRGDASIAVHKSQLIDEEKYKTADIQNIARPRGFIGKNELEEKRFPDAMHHFKIIYNPAGKGRVFYRYVGSIKFLKNLK